MWSLPRCFGNSSWIACAMAALCATPCVAVAAADSEPVRVLSRMSLEELANVEVTSVSKSAESLAGAPASVYVITREEIRRSGAGSVPEALRLAPNLHVVQLTAGDYNISARGFNGSPEAQNFPNKILILIDGRSVYNALFSGVAYDSQDVLMDDVDRIEVISGPGATLWGANAMNGVINIITRSATETRGGLLRAGGGNQEDGVSARYGGPAGSYGAYRVYGKAFSRDALELADGADAGDDWQKAQGGVRLDLARDRDLFTFQGDVYSGDRGQAAAADSSFSGLNVLARWTHATDRTETRVQAYFDHIERDTPVNGVGFDLDTWDIELQQSITIGSRHTVVWGAGSRSHHYAIDNTASLQFQPPQRSLHLADAFVQDSIALTPDLRLTAGLKMEQDAFSDWTALPDLRLAWSASPTTTIWAAASRAIRAATPFDVDVVEILGGTTFLTGNADFDSEEVVAYQLGYRGQPTPGVTIDVSAFFNVLDDHRTIEPAPTGFLPLRWDNEMEGESWGIEAWATFQATNWWRVSPGLRTLHKRLDFKPGASGLLGTGQAGNDPSWQASLKSSMDLGCCVALDAYLRYVDDLPEPDTPDYYELSARLGWQATEQLEVAVNGLNLLRSNHVEFAPAAGERIPRSFLVEASWNF